MNCEITRRTFEALKYPKGSKERKALNENGITSEYMKSYHWQVTGKNFSFGYRTREEALNFAENS